MTTPTTEQIREKALELYMQEQETKGFSDVSTPEDHELKEEGTWLEAKKELMSPYPDSVNDALDATSRKALADNEKLREKVKELRQKLCEKPEPKPVIIQQPQPQPQGINVTMTVPVLNMKVYYEQPKPQKPKAYPIKIRGQTQAKTCRYAKRFLKLTYTGLVWTGRILILFFAALEHVIETR